MPDPSQNSFIPKRGPATHRRGSASRKVYLFTWASYVITFATLLSVGGVFFYGQYLEQQRDAEIAALDAAISKFSEATMQDVLQFNRRLQQATGRFDNHVSVPSVLEAIEDATVGTVKFNSLDIQREADASLIVHAEIVTDSFDSTIFQREIYSTGSTISGAGITGIDVSAVDGDVPAANSGEGVAILKPTVLFSAVLSVPVANVPYTIDDADSSVPVSSPVPVAPVATATTTGTDATSTTTPLSETNTPSL